LQGRRLSMPLEESPGARSRGEGRRSVGDSPGTDAPGSRRLAPRKATLQPAPARGPGACRARGARRPAAK
jgi:hypothetical protein